MGYKGEVLRRRGQLHFSDNEKKAANLRFCRDRLEPICTTDTETILPAKDGEMRLSFNQSVFVHTQLNMYVS